MHTRRSSNGGGVKPPSSGKAVSGHELLKGPYSGLYTRIEEGKIYCSSLGITLQCVPSNDPAKYGSLWRLCQPFPNGGSRHVSTLWGREFEAGSIRYRISDAGNDQFLVTAIRQVEHRDNRRVEARRDKGFGSGETA